MKSIAMLGVVGEIFFFFVIGLIVFDVRCDFESMLMYAFGVAFATVCIYVLSMKLFYVNPVKQVRESWWTRTDGVYINDVYNGVDTKFHLCFDQEKIPYQDGFSFPCLVQTYPIEDTDNPHHAWRTVYMRDGGYHVGDFCAHPFAKVK